MREESTTYERREPRSPHRGYHRTAHRSPRRLVQRLYGSGLVEGYVLAVLPARHQPRAGNSVEVVLRSDDLRRWRPVIDFESPAGVADGCAAADGHFCTTPDRLYLFIGTRNPIHSYVSWTDDGVHWSQPALLSLGDDHPYTWRVPLARGAVLLAICHLHHEERPFELIVSRGRHPLDPTAEIVTRAELPEFTEESELYWRPDGELWCIVRVRFGFDNASMYWSQPPYTAWEGGDLQVKCDAPVICRTAGREYLSGRVRLPGAESSSNPTQFQGGEWGGIGNGTTGLYYLTKGKAELIRYFPQGGDASYPGLVSPEPGKLVISYYSDVAYWTGLVKPRHFAEFRYKASESDIYLAELRVNSTMRP